MNIKMTILRSVASCHFQFAFVNVRKRGFTVLATLTIDIRISKTEKQTNDLLLDLFVKGVCRMTIPLV